MFFGTIGTGYFVYGRKQQKLIPLMAGVALCVYPFFFSNAWILALVGIALTVWPWVMKD